MPEKFIHTDIAVARGIRAVEAAQGEAIRAGADLLSRMIAAGEARALPAHTGQTALEQIGELVAGAIRMRRLSVDAHGNIAALGGGIGLPVTALGDACQDDDVPQPNGRNVMPMRAVGGAQ